MKKQPKEVKIKDFKAMEVMGGLSFLYVLGEDGYMYFITHDQKNNDGVWHKMPSPSYQKPIKK